MSLPGPELERLVQIMARLRAEGGCPWDREQNLASLRPYLVEESFEVLDEMDRVSAGGPWRPLCEELGDLLFQIVFHAQLASELGEFSMADVAKAISDKIESRHPHVFGSEVVVGAEQVLSNWAKLKAEEKKRKNGSEGSVLDGVPTMAPALLRAERLTEKASRIGFDWPDVEGVREKLQEELGELDEAIASGNRAEIEHELGDVLFSLANLARFVKVPAEDALRSASARFTTRFQHIETQLKADGVAFGEAKLEEMERHWNAAKAIEKGLPPALHLPRAGLTQLCFAVPDVKAQRAFWDALAPQLGWQPVPGGPTEARYSDGLATWAFFEREGAGAGGGAEVTLGAPSLRAVEALRASLPATARLEGASVAFVDPSGAAWRYAFG